MTTHSIARVVICCLGSLGICTSSLAATDSASDVSAGRALYLQYCARCHGLEGKGDGRDAKRLWPRPRNFTSGTYKFRSTASGTSPSDDDLFHTLSAGLPGSGMPDWRHLDEASRRQLIAYLKTLSQNFESAPAQDVPLGSDPGTKHVDLAKGRQVYEKLGCASCHGPHGRANGPSASVLTDDWNNPIRPADLTQGWNYRGGGEPRAIVQRVLTGISGAPMPSYAGAASTEDVWQLAYYVRSLQREPRWDMIVHVPRIDGVLPTSAEDARWALAAPVDVRVRNTVNASGEMTRPPTVTAVTFQALANADAIAFRIIWDDPSEDKDNPADALAVALRPPEVPGDVISLQAWPLRDSPALDLCAWSASRMETREAVAASYEPARQGGTQSAVLPSQATYADGQWTLVFTRPFAPAEVPHAAHLVPSHFSQLAFSVWDAGNEDSHAVSSWIDLMIQPSANTQANSPRSLGLVWLVAGVVLVVGFGWVFKRS